MMVFVYPSWQLMLLWRKRSGSLRTLTIPTFCIITIITRCDDLQYLDGFYFYPSIRSFITCPKRWCSVSVVRKKASPNIWSLTH